MPTTEEVEILRARVHTMSDLQQTWLGQQAVMLHQVDHLTRTCEVLHAEMAQKTQLKDAIETLSARVESTALSTMNALESNAKIVDQRMVNLADKVEPLQKAVYFIIALVVASFFGGLIAVVYHPSDQRQEYRQEPQHPQERVG